MAQKLVYYGNETLKKIAREVTNIDGELVKFVDNMFNVMYKHKGIGLAAPQIEVSKRIIVLDIEDRKGPSIALINPVIQEKSRELEPYEEGCLSLPGLAYDVVRPKKVTVSGITVDGDEVEVEADGLYARVLQHEIDHLDGILFIDHLEKDVKNELRPLLKKIRKLNE